MKLSPDILRDAYRLLRGMAPFKSWGLPSAEDVVFYVTRGKDHGSAAFDGISHVMKVSQVKHGHTANLLQTVAHEMVHFAEVERYGVAGHGKRFQRMARIVCRYHGFDLTHF